MLMGKLKSTEEGGDDQINQFSSKFRTSHTHLTVFILRYNNSIVSKVIAYYLHYVLPFHAYCIVYNVFRQSNLSRKTAIYNVLVMSLLWFFLMVITIVVAKVNDEICKSGPILGSVFAKKGVLMFSKRRRLSSIWVANSETSWSREAIKLATCYEMIWRVDNQLTFTAGQMNLTMNWSFIWELTYLYTSFVFLFCGKFVSKDDDYITSHTRLTAFILRYNNSIVSKVIAYYLHYVLPFHIYTTGYRVSEQSNLLQKTAIYNVLLMTTVWFFLLVLPVVVPKVNNEICKSGPTLGAIFAKKGVLVSVKKRRPLSNTWVARDSETSWSREAIKLATCYEMIWRVDNQLTFTAGQMGPTMNWSFIWKLAFLYVYFVRKFISKNK
ncbi:hypothetical protein TYRP_011945 [Tyrophagus putrescentiae]|nr:hypothetical protein TYRP_011945 [Tyrophagus putrescentiae]